jgi:hypothetical protein
LPTPGPLAATAGFDVVALVALELLDDELLPQAARPTTSASAAELPAIRVPNLLNLVPLIRLLLCVELPIQDHQDVDGASASTGGRAACS